MTRRSSGFSLIEILISILILALGVLGLGALFPVVIREQRLGNDTVTGVAVSNNARLLLTQANWAATLPYKGSTPHVYFKNTTRLWERLRYIHGSDNDPYRDPSPPTAQITQGLGAGYAWNARDDVSHPAEDQDYAFGEWYVGDANGFGMLNKASGSARIGPPGRSSPTDANTTGQIYSIDQDGTREQTFSGVYIPMAQRVYPQSAGEDPQLIWDFVVQRVPGKRTFLGTTLQADPRDDGLRAAVFVRRIDPRIRTPNGESLIEALSSTATPRLFAVGEETDSAPVDRQGNPTLDGTGQYSAIRTIAVEFWYQPGTDILENRDRLYFAPNALSTQRLRTEFALLRQPGQKIVDNLGNIYTVVGSGSETTNTAQGLDMDGTAGAEYLKVEPPVPSGILESMAAPEVRGTDHKRAIRQIAYTAQVPVSVTLVDLLPKSDR